MDRLCVKQLKLMSVILVACTGSALRGNAAESPQTRKPSISETKPAAVAQTTRTAGTGTTAALKPALLPATGRVTTRPFDLARFSSADFGDVE